MHRILLVILMAVLVFYCDLALSQVQSNQPPEGMVFIPEGNFKMGSSQGQGEKDEEPQRSVWINGFYIDKYELTVEKYEACVKAGVCSKPATGPACNWDDQTKKKHPVNCVSWTQADSYCKWVGKRLPTEAEWEKAARGKDGSVYPWGTDVPTCDYAVIWDKTLGFGCGKNGTWEVGSKPKGVSSYGLFDMTGNVWEWVSDWLDWEYYTQNVVKNPQGPETGTAKVFKGGSWYDSDPYYLRAAFRSGYEINYKHFFVGFRCAKSM